MQELQKSKLFIYTVIINNNMMCKKKECDGYNKTSGPVVFLCYTGKKRYANGDPNFKLIFFIILDRMCVS